MTKSEVSSSNRYLLSWLQSGIKILCCITEANFYLHLVSQILEYRNSEKNLLGGRLGGVSSVQSCGVTVCVREREG